MPKETKTVGFEIDKGVFKLLEDAASVYELTAHKFARIIVIRYLMDTEREERQEKLSTLQTSVDKMSDNVADLLEAAADILDKLETIKPDKSEAG